MKYKIENLLHLAIKHLQASGELPARTFHIEIETPKDLSHGDLSTNLALTLAQFSHKPAITIAKRIVDVLPSADFIQSIEIAGPGFINFFLTMDALVDVVKTIIEQKDRYGFCKIGRAKKVLVEFVSSNPTGPLEIRHGRHAAFGDVIAKLLSAVGFEVSKEFYVNDSGKEMDEATAKVWLAYLACCGSSLRANVQSDFYQNIAKKIYQQYQNYFDAPVHLMKALSMDESIAITKNALQKKYQTFFNQVLEYILEDIRDDLAEFNVFFDVWSSERQFATIGSTSQLLSRLRAGGYVYEKHQALWFRSTDFYDEKDRELINANDEHTFFANDAAYHLSKFDRGFDIAVDLFDAAYEAYVPGIKSAIAASLVDQERLQTLFMQSVVLQPDNENKIQTFRALRHAIGNNTARLMYLAKHPQEKLCFDLEFAQARTKENPMYFLTQTLDHAERVLTLLAADETNGLNHLSLLTDDLERQLLNTLSRYPDMIINAAIHYEPQVLTHYLHELASGLNRFLNSKTLTSEKNKRDAQFVLVLAAKQVFLNGLNLLGIHDIQRQ